MRRSGSWILALAIGCSSPSLFAQDALDEMFGQAVHAFNKGQYQCSYDLLSSAIGSGSQDPRVYYFRGLATNALQGPGAGADDLQRGAELEANATRVVNVGRALEKIQGCQRLEIEKYRRNARIQARAQQEMIQRARIEAAQQSGLTPLPPTPGEGVIADPFANGLIEGEPRRMPPEAPKPSIDPKVEEVPAQPSTEPVADPFGGDAKPADDPFADPPAKKEDAGSDDPFGGN